jgi:hypothetical protein
MYTCPAFSFSHIVYQFFLFLEGKFLQNSLYCMKQFPKYIFLKIEILPIALLANRDQSGCPPTHTHDTTFDCVKGQWQQKILLFHLKERLKSSLKSCYICFISCLILEIFWLKVMNWPPSWMFEDMHDTSQVGSRNFFFSTVSDQYEPETRF